MEKEEILALIKKHKWNACCGPLNYMLCYGFMIGFMRMKRYYKEYYKNIFLSINKGVGCQISDEEQNYKNIKQVYENPNIKQLISHWIKDKINFYSKSEKLLEDIDKIDDKELVKRYESFLESFIDIWVLPLAVDAIGVYTETELLNDFKNFLKFESQEYFSLLCRPTHLSFIIKEHVSLLKLALLYKSKNKQFEKLLDKHKSSYFWVENNYRDVKILDRDYFLGKIKKESKKDKKEINKEINKLLDTKSIKKKQSQLFAKLRLSESLKEKLLLTQLFGIWQDHRKEMCIKGDHYVTEFLKEFGKRKKIALEEIYYTSPEELKDIVLKNKKVSKKIIKQRMEKIVQFVEQPDKETIFTGKDAEEIQKAFEKKRIVEIGAQEIKGFVASQGIKDIYRGKVKVVLDPKKTDFKQGEILVASMTRPEYVPLMKKAKAIVTDEGGITSHAAIISRELKIPCIIGTKIATKVLKDGDLIEVDANKGIVRKIK